MKVIRTIEGLRKALAKGTCRLDGKEIREYRVSRPIYTYIGSWWKVARRIFRKRVISGEQLLEGYEIPKGWGISYVRWDADLTIIHPLPLNYVVAGTRWLMHKIKLPWFVKKEQERMQGEYFKGWTAGWKDCSDKHYKNRVRQVEGEDGKREG